MYGYRAAEGDSDEEMDEDDSGSWDSNFDDEIEEDDRCGADFDMDDFDFSKNEDKKKREKYESLTQLSKYTKTTNRTENLKLMDAKFVAMVRRLITFFKRASLD